MDRLPSRTEVPFAQAIGLCLLKENTYDKKYLDTHTIGFEEFRRHILGEDGTAPRRRQVGGRACDVPARVIIALAREWALKRTSLAGGVKGGEGGACRMAYATESARMMVLLQAMQGLGKPGVKHLGHHHGPPYNADLNFPDTRPAA